MTIFSRCIFPFAKFFFFFTYVVLPHTMVKQSCIYTGGGSVAEWLASWTQAQKSLG